MSTDVRWGVMGTGLISRVTMDIERAEGCTVTCMASRDPARAQARIDEFELPHATPSTYEDVLSRDDIDAVYIALPNHLHVGWAIRLLKAGKHVLVEKPLTPFKAEAEAVYAAAKAANRLCVEGFMYMHHPQTETLIEIARGGEDSIIGPLRMIRADRGFDLRDRPTVNTRFSHRMQGGALMDLGCYPLSIATWVAGAHPGEAHALCQMAEPLPDEELPIDGTMTFQLKLDNGVLVEGVCSLLNDSIGARFDLIGEWGSAHADWAYSPQEDRAVIRTTRNKQHPQGEGEGEIVIENGGSRVVNQFANFAKAVRGEMEPRPTAAWSIHHAATMERLLNQCGVDFPASARFD